MHTYTVYMYIYMRIQYICIHMHICICIHAHAHTRVCACTHTYMYGMYVCMCNYVCMHVCMYDLKRGSVARPRRASDRRRLSLVVHKEILDLPRSQRQLYVTLIEADMAARGGRHDRLHRTPAAAHGGWGAVMLPHLFEAAERPALSALPRPWPTSATTAATIRLRPGPPRSSWRARRRPSPSPRRWSSAVLERIVERTREVCNQPRPRPAGNREPVRTDIRYHRSDEPDRLPAGRPACSRPRRPRPLRRRPRPSWHLSLRT